MNQIKDAVNNITLDTSDSFEKFIIQTNYYGNSNYRVVKLMKEEDKNYEV